MSDLERLIRQIQLNCDISDARHGGIFSICGLALRLRDLFKWEHGLAPWEEGDPAAVLEWIGDREAFWETLAGSDLVPLTLNGRAVDAFDSEAVNDALASHGLYYGAGYARGLKPTFFLAMIEDEQEIEGCRVYRLGRERARDLLALPALSQNRVILLRRQSAASQLWDQIAYIPPSGQGALHAALSACGIAGRRPSELRRRWDALLRVQEMIHLRHEIGEVKEDVFRRDRWQAIIAAFPLTRVELLARHIKDLLADTHPLGPLCHFGRTRDAAGAGLYLAFTDRLARNLFPQLAPAVNGVLHTGDWAALARAVAVGRSSAQRYADILVGAYDAAASRDDLARLPTAVDRLMGRFFEGGG